MNPLLIALFFVVAMALPAVLVVKHTVKPKPELALAHSPARRWITRSDEGSVVVPVRAPESDAANKGSKKLELAKPTKQQQASDLDHQVDDTIRRLILMN